MDYVVPNEVKKYFSAYKYKIELHAHTSPCSACSRISAREMIRLHKQQNYDVVVITNHFLYGAGEFRKSEDPVSAYLQDFYEAKEEGEKLGIKVLLGIECRFLENLNDYLVYGVDEQFLRNIVNRSELDLQSFYQEFHNENLLVIEAHPCREGHTVANLNFLDGLETMNMDPNNNSRIARAIRFADEEHVPIVTVGTDLHRSENAGLSALRTKVLPDNEIQLVQLLRSGDYIFDIGGHPFLPYYTF